MVRKYLYDWLAGYLLVVQWNLYVQTLWDHIFLKQQCIEMDLFFWDQRSLSLVQRFPRESFKRGSTV